jgi:hypothetical protein
MAVLMTLELAGATTAQYDRMKELAGLGADGVPEGLVGNACAVTDDGIVIAQVWESQSELDEFVRDRLAPALEQAAMPEPVPRMSPVHDMLFGAGKEPAVLVTLHAIGLSTEVYDAIVAKMTSHAGRGESHPSVLHVAAADTDGFRIVDLYDSEETYREFTQTELLPAMDNPRHFVLRVWPVHDCVLVRPRASA